VDPQSFGSNRLKAAIVARHELDEVTRGQMFALFARHYSSVTRAGFEIDLAAKDFAVVLYDAGAVAGFTTAAYSNLDVGSREIGIVFSGDTIVDPAYWGEQALARAWLAEIGRIAALNSGREIYWLLIVKGHRTYRYLPTFALEYVPGAGTTDQPELLALRNAVAADRFGDAFDPQTGLIRFADPRGQLHPAIAEPLPRERNNPHVRYFLEANPGFRDGDELACLCSLAPANMRSRARRWFANGAD
jgi:hypothetical protein